MAIKIKINKDHELLSEACINNDLNEVKKLIEKGIDLTEIWTAEGYYPLMAAIEKNNVEMVCLLADRGMPLYMNCKSLYRQYEPDEVAQDAVFGYWENDSAEALLAVLNYVNGDELKEACSYALASLANRRDEEVNDKTDQFLEKLLEKGADVDFPCRTGGTMLHSIAEGRNRKYTDKLIRLSKKIDAPSSAGEYATPLYMAFSKCYSAPIELLLELGANSNAFSIYDNKSVLDRALRCKKKNKLESEDRRISKLIELLKSHGAKTYSELMEAEKT